MIETRHLTTFVAVVRARSFSGAAHALGYTQSAVSQHVAALEAELDQPLLHRRPVAPTRAGERLLAHAEAVLLRLGAAETELRAEARAEQLRLGIACPFPAAALGAVVGLAEDATLRALSPAAAIGELAADAIDLALLGGYGRPGEPLLLADPSVVATALVVEEPVVAVLPTGHPFVDAPGLDLGDFADAFWIDAPRLAAPLGLRAAITYDGVDLHTLLGLVAAQRGMVVLPASAIPAGAAGVRAVPVTAPTLVHRVEVAWLRGAPPSRLEALVSALRR